MADDRAAIDRRMERFTCDPFDKDKTTWDAYSFQIDQMFRAKGLSGDGPNATAARRTLLLAYVGSEALAAVRHHFYPDDVNTKTYNEVKTALENMYKPSLTIFAARMAFEKASRSESETMVQFANRLRQLSAVCNYGNHLDERLRDRFAAGANHSKFEVELRQRWPDGQTTNAQGANVNVLFQTVLELAISMERAEKECAHQQDSGANVNMVKSKQAKLFGESKWKGTCSRCGRVDIHSSKDCPHRKSTCFKCGGKGHISSMCHRGDDSSSSEQESGDDDENPKGKSRGRKGPKPKEKKSRDKIDWVGSDGEEEPLR